MQERISDPAIWPPAPSAPPSTARPAEGGVPVAQALVDRAAAAAAALAKAPRGRDKTLSCVIPCWNEAANLQRLLPMLSDILGGLADAWEIILIDDGSTDHTGAVLAQWAQRPGFRALQLSRNFGKEAALTAGLEAAHGDAVILMDADLQHPPSLLPTLVEHWRRGIDVVYAVRSSREDEGFIKRLGARGFYALVNAADRFELPAGAGDFRLLDRAAVNALLALPERNRFMKGLYAWIGFDTMAVPYMPDERASGGTSFNFSRLIHLSLDGLTGFSTGPLRAVGIVGFVFAILSFLYGTFLTIDYLLFGNEVSGWTTIVVSILFVFGVQMTSLGIMGLYIGRIFEEVKARPIYLVKRDLGRGLDPGPR